MIRAGLLYIYWSHVYTMYIPIFEFVTKWKVHTLESGIDVGQGINVGPGKFVKRNKRRAQTKCAKLCYKKPIKLENICRPWKKFQHLINVGSLIRL